MTLRFVPLLDCVADEPHALTDGPFGSKLKSDHYTTTGVRVIRLGNVGVGAFEDSDRSYVDWAYAETLRRHHVREGDLVIAALAEPVGRCCQVPAWLGPALVKADCIKFRVRAELNPRFIMHWLNSPSARRNAEAASHGVGRLRINMATIRDLPVPVCSRGLQDRIVAAIETHFSRLDAAVASLERAKANARRARASILRAAVEGRLPSCQAGPTRLRDGWTVARIDELFEQRLGKMLDAAKNQGNPRPYLRNVNVRWFHFDLSDVKEIRVTDEELASVSVKSGDIVVCEGGEPGRSAVWTSAGETFVIQKACHRLRPLRDLAPKFFTFVLWVEADSGRLARHFTGSTIKHLTGRSLRPLVVPVPPMAEQLRIVDEVERRFSVLDSLEATLDANLARCARLRQAILKRAFEGRLVDEPVEASVEAAAG